MSEKHCWADGPALERVVPIEGVPAEFCLPVGTTCMLPDGHAGPHVWTPDDRIGIEFSPGGGISSNAESVLPVAGDGRHG